MQSSMTIKPFQRMKRCYYCGAPGPSTKEHAPCKRMFEAFDCDSITVPACDEHNSHRSRIDRAIMALLLRTLEYRFRTGSLTDNQLEAYRLAQPKLKHAREVTNEPLVIDPPEGLDIPIPYISETAMVETYMQQLTAAMVWAVSGAHDPQVNWDKAVIWSPNYTCEETNTLDIAEAAYRLREQQTVRSVVRQRAMHWWRGWSSFPKPYPSDIYRFEVSLVPAQYLVKSVQEREVIFRHWFFGEQSWYVWLLASDQMYGAITNAIATIK